MDSSLLRPIDTYDPENVLMTIYEYHDDGYYDDKILECVNMYNNKYLCRSIDIDSVPASVILESLDIPVDKLYYVITDACGYYLKSYEEYFEEGFYGYTLFNEDAYSRLKEQISKEYNNKYDHLYTCYKDAKNELKIAL